MPRPSRAPLPDISSGFTGATRKIRTNAPSLVITKPVRSTVSTPSSSPVSRSDSRLDLAASITGDAPTRPATISGPATRSSSSWLPEQLAAGLPSSPRLPSRLSSSASSAYPVMSPHPGTNLAAGAPPADRRADQRPQVELGLRGNESGNDGQPAHVHPGHRRPEPADGAEPVRPREPDKDSATIAAICPTVKSHPNRSLASRCAGAGFTGPHRHRRRLVRGARESRAPLSGRGGSGRRAGRGALPASRVGRPGVA